MIPLVPVIVSQNAYILYVRAPRFGDPVQGTGAGDGQPAAQSRRYSSRDLSPGFRRFAPTSPPPTAGGADK